MTEYQEANMKDSPFWTKSMIYLALGLTVCPVFLLCAMHGTDSKNYNEYFAGRLSRLICMIHMIFFSVALFLWIFISVSISVAFQDKHDRDRYEY